MAINVVKMVHVYDELRMSYLNGFKFWRHFNWDTVLVSERMERMETCLTFFYLGTVTRHITYQKH